MAKLNQMNLDAMRINDLFIVRFVTGGKVAKDPKAFMDLIAKKIG